MIKPGDIISYPEMCAIETTVQKGMNFRIGGNMSIFLMSVRKGAPYADKVENNGAILIYEGHDVPNNSNTDPKNQNQALTTIRGTLTENGKFFKAAQDFKEKGIGPELIKVYEKIKPGIWVYNGIFELKDAWEDNSSGRIVFKFRLEIKENYKSVINVNEESEDYLEHNRLIPSEVKREVWKRDKGKCITCGSSDNLHFDHIIPYSKGGTSLKAENIQLLCARHNLKKHNKII